MEKDIQEVRFVDCLVVGAGVSGIAVARWLKYYKHKFVLLERETECGGLWRYKDNGYGVMQFTHINVSKYNYCFSDHEFSSESNEYPHHSEMFQYIKSYVEKHKIYENILFKFNVEIIEKSNSNDLLFQKNHLLSDFELKSNHLWKITTKDLTNNITIVYFANYVCISSGHHGIPSYPDSGFDNFKGTVLHSVDYKSATFNGIKDKNVLVVGIGNSAVDIAVNLATEGSSKVCISTRSGAWIIPNYISGFATDLYACRFFLQLPWQLTTYIMETVIKFIYGNPKKYNLNPKMRALQTQPTVSPTLIHHIQRKHILIKPDIKEINGNEVKFENGDLKKFDTIILCTGFKIHLNFLHPDLQKDIISSENNHVLNLYKNVFSPKIGNSLGFIGFVQPSSGGVISVSEIQARWFVHLMNKDIKLPTESEMLAQMKKDQTEVSQRFRKSPRHTIQVDPIKYNDEVSEFFGAKPDLKKNPLLIWKLMFSSCGPAQWRINGPERLENALEIINHVPITTMMKSFGLILILLTLIVLCKMIQSPLGFVIIASFCFLCIFYSKLMKKKAGRIQKND